MSHTPQSALPVDRGRFAALDGLRGIAFLLVFMAHLNLPAGLAETYPWLEHAKEFGWVGVPIFFLLSGFLITELALREASAFSLTRFYARRALRLWPLYFTAVGLALLAWQSPVAREAHVGVEARWAPALLTFTLNFYLAEHWSGWRDSLGSVIVFWTLAVEEQFYAFWAPVLKWCSRTAGLWICLAIIVAALVVRFTAPFEPPFLLFRINSLSNFGSIMLGCALALSGGARLRLGMLSSIGATTGLILAAVAIATLGWPLPTNGLRAAILLTCVDAFSLAFVIVAVCGDGPLSYVLRSPLLRRLGDLSYAGYVIHFTALWFYYYAMPRLWPVELLRPEGLAALTLDASIVFAFTVICAGGWYALEAPMRRWRARLHST